jgi:hypothetical protein
MFPVLVFASHFQILLVRKPDTQPECFTTHLVAPYRYISLVSTHKTIYGCQKHKFWTICFRFAPHRMCDAKTLLHAQPTHSPELPRSVGRDIDNVTSGGHYGWIWLTFWTFIIQRQYILGLSHEFIFKQFMSTERTENACCNEHKFVSPEIVNFLGV